MECAAIVRAVVSVPWAIREERLTEIAERIKLMAGGASLAARRSAAPTQRAGKGVAVIPIMGILTHRPDLFSYLFGATSTDSVKQSIRAAVQDPSIGSIVLDIDSPGGAVYGTQELGNEIYNATTKKNIVAIANGEAASAAYWIGSQASELLVTPSGEVGSIGVIAMHDDFSKALEMKGIKSTMITAGKYKGEGWPEFPLSAEARDYVQSQVDAYYSMFVKAVARGRGVSQKAVRDGFGQGRMVLAQQAVKEGMADRVGTLDGAVTRLLANPRNSSAHAAARLRDERRRFEIATR